MQHVGLAIVYWTIFLARDGVFNDPVVEEIVIGRRIVTEAFDYVCRLVGYSIGSNLRCHQGKKERA